MKRFFYSLVIVIFVGAPLASKADEAVKALLP
ncbi:uncharacterized protein METZ01_LOCUS367866, partial [marine metagenome]